MFMTRKSCKYAAFKHKQSKTLPKNLFLILIYKKLHHDTKYFPQNGLKSPTWCFI